MITIQLKERGQPFGKPHYVRAIEYLNGRPAIITTEEPCEPAQAATVDNLSVLLDEVLEASDRIEGYRIRDVGFMHEVAA